jgi:hypothetical protein
LKPTDVGEAVELVEGGNAAHISGSFCEGPDVYDEDGNHVLVGGSEGVTHFMQRT